MSVVSKSWYHIVVHCTLLIPMFGVGGPGECINGEIKNLRARHSSNGNRSKTEVLRFAAVQNTCRMEQVAPVTKSNRNMTSLFVTKEWVVKETKEAKRAKVGRKTATAVTRVAVAAANAKKVTLAPDCVPLAAASVEEKSSDHLMYMRMTKTALKGLCKRLDLPVSGKKDQLAKRLAAQQAMREE